MSTRRSGAVVIGLVAAFAGACATLMVLGRVNALAMTFVVLTVLVGWSFVVAGLLAWGGRSPIRGGPLMILAGLAWFAHLLTWSHVALLTFAGNCCGSLYAAVLGHALLALPAGRVVSAPARLLMAAGYLVAGPLHVAAVVLAGGLRPLSWPAGVHGPAEALLDVEYALGVCLAAGVLATLVARKDADADARRAVGPVPVAGGLALAGLGERAA